MVVAFWAAVYALFGVAACVCCYRAGISIGAERLKALQDTKGNNLKAIAPAINYINNVLLPDPEDPRWNFFNNPSRMQLGDVWISITGTAKEIRIGALDHFIKWETNDNENIYCVAVITAWAGRKSMEAIEHTELLPSNSQSESKGV